MRLVLSARIDAAAGELERVVGDLATYPRWLKVVQRVVPDGGDAWLVDIGARVGVVRRTKRVRMVRAGPLRFERDEGDGVPHPPWVLDATVDGADLSVVLSYGGTSLAVAALEPLLRIEAARAPGRLRRLLAD